MEQAPAQGGKRYGGLALLTYSGLAFGFAALAPLLFSLPVAATVAIAAIVSGEIAFWLSLGVLGKPFVSGLQARLEGCFIPRAEGGPSRQASRAQM
jgi:hypothetical protein